MLLDATTIETGILYIAYLIPDDSTWLSARIVLQSERLMNPVHQAHRTRSRAVSLPAGMKLA